jgi:hypothetical protein
MEMQVGHEINNITRTDEVIIIAEIVIINTTQ